MDAVVEEKTSDERAHCPALFPVIKSGNASRRNKFDRPSRFMPPLVKQQTYRRFLGHRGEEKTATVRACRITAHLPWTPPSGRRNGGTGESSPRGNSGVAVAFANAILHPRSRGHRNQFVTTPSFTLQPAPNLPAPAVPAAGSAPCNPSCASRGPNSRDIHRQGPCVGPERCDRES
jgi:hypothetical protein